MIKVIKNIVSKKDQIYLNDIINSNEFPWYFYDNIIEGRNKNYKKFKNITETYAFVHTLFFLPKGINSNYFEKFKIILNALEKKENIKIKELLRIRIRKTFFIKGHNLNKFNHPHVDLPEVHNYKSLIYYFENSDGDTVFFKEKFNEKIKDINNLNIDLKNTPKQGMAVYFDGDIFHSGNSPVNYIHRTVLNFDFKIYDKNN
jgi:hypothetical protein